MFKSFRFIKAKVTMGYAILIVALLSSFYLIHRELEMLSASNEYENELILKRKAINHTLACLFQAESIGQGLSTGRLENYPRYEKAMKELLVSIDTLKHFSQDSSQHQRINTISRLLQQKEENMMEVLRSMDAANNDQLYQQNIERILKQQDLLVKQQRVQRKVIIKQDSVLTKHKKRGFFKRLADVFAPDKEEITKVLTKSCELSSDTLLQAYNPADTVAEIFREIQSEITNKQHKIRNLVDSKTMKLQKSNLTLNGKINQLIRNFEQEEMNRSIHKLEHQHNIKQRAMHTIVGIAILSVLLAACFLLIIWKDITKSNLYRKELEIAHQRAEELLRIRERLMLTITHDFKAPLGSIMGYTDLLSRLTQDKRQLFYLTNMKSSSEHLLRLVNDLLDFHRLESNKMEINRIAFNPAQLFDEIKISFDPLAQNKGLTLKYDCGTSLNSNFYGDPLRIRQITNNLLSNALKFTPQGNVTLSVSLATSILIITINDTGKGMSQDEQQRIFEEFTRLSSAQGEEGFGLGLSITQKLVNLLSGSIEVESKQNQGSIFTVRIPLEKNTENTEIKPQQPKEVSSQRLGDIRVLMIDDDRIQLELTAAMLQQQGIETICCQQSDELFEYLRNESFTHLLTDVQMPTINGFDLLQLLRVSHLPQANTIPVIAVTARSDMDRESLVQKGFTDVLHKPFSATDLYAIIGHTAYSNNIPKSCTEVDNSYKYKFSALTSLCNDDKESAKAIIHSFIDETEKNRNSLSDALHCEDAISIAAIAHKLLPLFTLIGASACIPSLTWLETERNSCFSQKIEITTKLLLKEIDSTIHEAKQFLKQTI